MTARRRWLAAAEEIVLRACWPPAAVASAHVLASKGLDAYRAFLSLDVPMHLAGGFAIAVLFSRSLAALGRQGLIGPVELRLEAWLGIALTCCAAIAWEVLEYTSDNLLGTHSQGTLADTLLDIALGTAGGAALFLGRRLRARASSDRTPSQGSSTRSS